MSDTYKHEFHKPDGFHLGHRLARQARPAGRILAFLESEDMFGPECEDLFSFFPEDYRETSRRVTVDECDGYTPVHRDSPCGGFCRRCLLHDDPGGCLVGEQVYGLLHLLSFGRIPA